jgi:hypothetical protein
MASSLAAALDLCGICLFMGSLLWRGTVILSYLSSAIDYVTALRCWKGLYREYLVSEIERLYSGMGGLPWILFSLSAGL